MGFSGKNAIITGAGGGMGLATAHQLLAEGSSVTAVNGGAKRDDRGGVRRDRLAAAGLSP